MKYMFAAIMMLSFIIMSVCGTVLDTVLGAPWGLIISGVPFVFLFRLSLLVLPDGHGEKDERIEKAIELAVKYGGIDGDHHKAWVIDQMVRELARDSYEQIVEDAKMGEYGPNTYEWDEGIAP